MGQSGCEASLLAPVAELFGRKIFFFKLERKITFDDSSGVLVMFLWIRVQELGSAGSGRHEFGG